MLPEVDYYGRPLTRKRADAMSDEEVESGLASLARNTGSYLQTLGLALDTPGAIARGVLAGDPYSGFAWDAERRVSGEDLLKSYGVLDDNSNRWGAAAAGLATEIGTDPLSFLTLPMSSLTKAGKAAKAANILDLAPIAAQRRMGTRAAGQTMTGRLTDSALNELLPQGLAKTDANYAVRPLVGPRLARTQATLDDVVQSAADPVKAMDEVTKYLTSKGSTYDAVKDEKLGGAFGVGFLEPWMTFTPPGSEKALDALDAVGQSIAWSKPARVASALFDQRVAGMTDTGDQIAALRQFKDLDTARQVGRRAASEHAQIISRIPMSDGAKELLGADSLMSPQGNDFLTRAFENKATAADRQLMQELPGINDAIASWDKIRRNNIDSAKNLGLAVNEYKDSHGTLYSPRSGGEFDFGEYGEGLRNSLFNTRTVEGMSRNPALATPGGTMDLREVSMLPIVRQHAMEGSKSPRTIEEVGTAISDFLNRKHGRGAVDQAQGEAIAGTMYRMNKDLPDSYPVFADHPINAQARNIVNQEVARANAKHVYESLVESAINTRSSQVVGSGFKRLDSAAMDIAGAVGLRTDQAGLDPAVKQQIVERIAAKFGIDPGRVDLSQLAVPEAVYNRLKRVQDFYASPRAQQEVSGMLDGFTNLFKSFVLAWPARHVRDAYSNALSVWLETGSVTDTLGGFSMAKAILAGNIDSVMPDIAKLPQYQGISDPALLKQKFLGDIAASGVMAGMSSSDLLSSKRAGELSQLVPGSTPVTRMGAFRELLPDGSRNPLQMLGDATQIQGITNSFETRNPLLNWSQKLNDANDSIGRLGGAIALLRQGATMEFAADRMRAALVDYGSLTAFEKNVAKKIFPWWSYNSRIGKYVAESMMQKPGGLYSQAIRGMNTLQASDDETYIPVGMRQQFSVRLPDSLAQYFGGNAQPGSQTFLRDFDFPGVDTGSLLDPTSFQGTVANLFGQTNPLLKGAAELAFNRDLFTKRPLEQSDPAINKVYRYFTGDNLSPLAKVVGSNIPGTQRVVGLAGGLMNPDLPMEAKALKELFNAGAGVKVSTVDKKWRDQDATEQLMKGMGGLTRTMPITYVDKEAAANATPEEQQDILLFNALQQRKREAAKANKPPSPKKRRGNEYDPTAYLLNR